MENYFNGAVAGKDSLSQYIKHYSKEERKGKDDQDLKKGIFCKNQYIDRTDENLVSEFSSGIFGDKFLRLANHPRKGSVLISNL